MRRRKDNLSTYPAEWHFLLLAHVSIIINCEDEVTLTAASRCSGLRPSKRGMRHATSSSLGSLRMSTLPSLSDFAGGTN